VDGHFHVLFIVPGYGFGQRKISQIEQQIDNAVKNTSPNANKKETQENKKLKN